MYHGPLQESYQLREMTSHSDEYGVISMEVGKNDCEIQDCLEDELA